MRNEFLINFQWWLQRNAVYRRRENGKFILTQEKRMRKKISSIFNKQLNYITRELKTLLPEVNAIGRFQTNNLSGDIDEMLGGMPGKNSLVETILFYSSVTMNKGGQSTVKNLGLKEFGVSFSVKHPDAVKYLEQKKTLQLSNYKGSIDFTTKSKIKELVLEGVQEGKSYTSIAKDIVAQGEAGVFSQARAELIAIREAGISYEYGKQVPIDDFTGRYPERQVLKYWQTAGDDRVTPECVENEEASPILYAEFFPNDGDQNTAPRSGNPRCRCNTQYEIV